jgi:hypothetical protein
MTRSSVRRKIAVALLGLFLVASLASAAERRTRSDAGAGIAGPSLWGLLDEIWRFLSSPSVWSKCGGSADPNGACKSQPAGGGSSATPFAGALPDPNG